MKTKEEIERLKDWFIENTGKEGMEAAFLRSGLDELIRTVIINAMPTEEDIKNGYINFQWALAAEDDYMNGLEDGFKGGCEWFLEKIREYIDAEFDKGDTE